MNDIKFIETLKQKRNACDYSQSRLALELQISRQNLNEIENGKTKASKEMKHILLHYLDYCNCTQPFTLTIDYLRVRFPTTDALEIIKNVLAMKSEYFIHEDYGMFGYEEQYIYGDISVNASKDSSMGVLLELRGMGCRNLEYVLQARGIDWYSFLSCCIDYQGVFKRIDLAINDMGGLLDIEILRERYYANKVWKRSRTHEAVDSGKLSGTNGDTAKTFYIGSKSNSIYFCLYEKEKEQKSKLLIDDETKWIIEKIFSLAYQGYGSAKITKILREEKVPTASWLNFTRYGTFAHIFEGKPESKRYEWTIAHVKAILKSEVYIGNSVHNRQSTISFKSKKKVRKPESEWFRVENTHEPIIDKEVFYRVQEQIKSRRRQTKEKATPIFAGLVKCADCGWSMRFATNKANKTPYSYYACSYYGQFGKGNCSMHYIRYDVLYQAVLERLQYWAKAVQQDEEKVLHKIQKVGNAERIREKKKKASALRKAENRQNEIDRLFAKMYEDRACEKITERNFIMLSGKYQKEQIELEQQITNLREELSKMEQDMIGAEKWIELIKEYSVPKELTAPLLNAMIEKILIHEATTNEENERIQEIEIYYRFIGKVD